METLQMCIEHLLRSEQQTHDERERIYHAVSSGRKDLAAGFSELVSNDRHGTAQRMGFLVGYASAFRMQSNFVTQARNTYGGHELADRYRNPDRPGLDPGAVAYAEYRNRDLNTFVHADNLSNGRGSSSGCSDIVDREERSMTSASPDQDIVDRTAATLNGHAETNGSDRADRYTVVEVPQLSRRQSNGIAAVERVTISPAADSTIDHNEISNIASTQDTATSNRDSVANGHSVRHTTPLPTGTSEPHLESAPSDNSAE